MRLLCTCFFLLTFVAIPRTMAQTYWLKTAASDGTIAWQSVSDEIGREFADPKIKVHHTTETRTIDGVTYKFHSNIVRVDDGVVADGKMCYLNSAGGYEYGGADTTPVFSAESGYASFIASLRSQATPTQQLGTYGFMSLQPVIVESPAGAPAVLGNRGFWRPDRKVTNSGEGYGSQIITVATDTSLYAACHDWSTKRIYIYDVTSGATATQKGYVESLGVLGGFTRDEVGGFYILTGKYEPGNSGLGTSRENTLWMYKLNSACQLVWTADLNQNQFRPIGKDPIAVNYLEDPSDPVYEPFIAGSSRIVYGNDQLFCAISSRSQKTGGSIIGRVFCLNIHGASVIPIHPQTSAEGHPFGVKTLYNADEKCFIALEKHDHRPTLGVLRFNYDQPYENDTEEFRAYEPLRRYTLAGGYAGPAFKYVLKDGDIEVPDEIAEKAILGFKKKPDNSKEPLFPAPMAAWHAVENPPGTFTAKVFLDINGNRVNYPTAVSGEGKPTFSSYGPQLDTFKTRYLPFYEFLTNGSRTSIPPGELTLIRKDLKAEYQSKTPEAQQADPYYVAPDAIEVPPVVAERAILRRADAGRQAVESPGGTFTPKVHLRFSLATPRNAQVNGQWVPCAGFIYDPSAFDAENIPSGGSHLEMYTARYAQETAAYKKFYDFIDKHKVPIPGTTREYRILPALLRMNVAELDALPNTDSDKIVMLARRWADKTFRPFHQYRTVFSRNAGKGGTWTNNRGVTLSDWYNNTYTTEGGIARGYNGNGYLVLFSSYYPEKTQPGNQQPQPLYHKLAREKPRDLGAVHVAKDFWKEPQNNSGDSAHNNHNYTFSDKITNSATTNGMDGAEWLTIQPAAADGPASGVERPKLVQLENNSYLAIWEAHIYDRNQDTSNPSTYQRTEAQLISLSGSDTAVSISGGPSTTLAATARLYWNDDPVLWGNAATWVTADFPGLLQVHTIDATLSHTSRLVKVP